MATFGIRLGNEEWRPINFDLSTAVASSERPNETFFGLAFYLDDAVPVVSKGRTFDNMEYGAEIELAANTAFGIAGRYNAHLLKFNQPVTLFASPESLSITYLPASATEIRFWQGYKSETSAIAPGSSLSYFNLWQGFAALAHLIESALRELANLFGSYGWAIVALAGLTKLLFSPLALLGQRLQSRVDTLESSIQPKLREIKSQFDGEEAHNKIMAVYKSHGVSPFHTMKPLLITLLIIPVFIATFNVLGELPELDGQAFLWIPDLAYPDATIGLPFTVPAMGNSLNILVFVMTGASILATVVSKRSNPDRNQRSRQILQLSVMSAAFFFLFYPFPSSMVLYWASTNLIAAGASLVVNLVQNKSQTNNAT